MSETVDLLATVKPREGKEEGFEANLKLLMEDVKQNEPGALMYLVFYDPIKKVYVLYERYADQAAFDLHKASSAIAKAGERSQAADDVEVEPVNQMLEFRAGFVRHQM